RGARGSGRAPGLDRRGGRDRAGQEGRESGSREEEGAREEGRRTEIEGPPPPRLICPGCNPYDRLDRSRRLDWIAGGLPRARERKRVLVAVRSSDHLRRDHLGGDRAINNAVAPEAERE